MGVSSNIVTHLHTIIMSSGIKIKDVLNVIRANKMDRSLGLLESPAKFR